MSIDLIATVQGPQRLDQFTAENFRLSRAQAIKRIRMGAVRLNGEVIVKAAKRLKAGDTVTLNPETKKQEKRSVVSSQRSVVPVLYEDDACLVVNKPAGLVVHPTGTMDGAEPTLVETLTAQNIAETPLLAHRLDKGTSGCLLVAKDVGSLDFLQKQFKDRTVRKRYLAVVAGTPKEKKATIVAHIGRSLLHRTKMSLFHTGESRAASTGYEVLSSSPTASLLRCTIHTGRTHQIRVHLSGIGHPIIGDRKYCSASSRELSEELGATMPILHAHELSFTSPATNAEVHVEAPIPDGFLNVAKKLDFEFG